MDLRKEDYLYILKRRGGHTTTTIQKLPLPALQHIASPLSSNEMEDLKKRSIAHQQYIDQKLTSEQLREECRLRGLASSGMNKIQLMDALMSTDNQRYEVVLDEDQKSIVHGDLQRMKLVSAGPGSGKTTTIVHLIHQHKDKKCLVLAFNRAARDNIKSRLKKLGLTTGNKKDLFSSHAVFVMDFDECAYQICKKINSGFFPSDYNETKTKAVQYLAKSNDLFTSLDLFIVDEAQDLSNVLGDLTMMLQRYSASFYVFGDPRQELYPGCVWFSSLWSTTSNDDKALLRYNHRSGKNIVDFLNKFSKENFPTLHHDQIAASDEDGNILFYDADHTSEDMLENTTYTDLCFLSPISIRKYKIEPKTNNIRQVVYSKFVLAPKVLDAEQTDFDIHKECVIATSKKFKGLEKNNVVVYGLDVNYAGLNIPWEALVKTIFVCISRAKKKLVLIYNKETMVNIRSPLSFLLPNVVTKRSDSAQIPNIRNNTVISIHELTEMEAIPAPPPMEVEEENFHLDITPQNDGDFISVFIKKHVARKLDCLKFGELTNVDHKQGGMSYQKVFGRCDKHKFLGQHDTKYFYNQGIENFVESIKNEYNSKTLDPYHLAVLDYSNHIMKPWTVSERLSTFTPDVQMICNILSTPLQSDVHLSAEICSGRSCDDSHRKLVTQIIANADFMNDDNAYQIKYVNEILPKHRREAGILAWMTGLPNVTIVDVKNNIIERISPIDDPTKIIHAFITMRVAQTFNLKTPQIVRCPKNNTVCVALDFETQGFSNKITEIGAVKYNPYSRTIIDIYHVLADGVEHDETGKEEWEEITGLSITNEEDFLECQTKIMKDLQMWCGDALVVHWGGSEKQYFENTIDMRQLYLNWCDLMKIKTATGNDLSNACDKLFCEGLVFSAHRAYDDAVATMGVHIAICGYSGTV